LAGIVFADDCAEAIKRGDKNLEKVLKRDIHRVTPDTPACDLIQLWQKSIIRRLL